LVELRRNNFAFIEVLEIMLRYYKAEPERLRPTDRMVAHTGYLIFARPLFEEHREGEPELELTQSIDADDRR
jgi:tRNA (adenine57-N1/adenine58-N1)-methyltransferase